jgi:hypothetical protein
MEPLSLNNNNNNNNNNNRGMKDCKAFLALPKHIEVIEKDPKSSLIPHFFFLIQMFFFFNCWFQSILKCDKYCFLK